jgi:DNA-binding transcriptional ArsR family regulator
MSLAAAFHAMGDPTRRRIVAFLAEGEAPVAAIAGEVALSQPAISQHLKVLREAGLVKVRPQAQQRLYSVNADELAEAGAWLMRMAGFWHDRLDALDAQLRTKQRYS